MPIDPFHVIAALVRAEAARTTTPVPPPRSSSRPAIRSEPLPARHEPHPPHRRTWRLILRAGLPRIRQTTRKAASHDALGRTAAGTPSEQLTGPDQRHGGQR